MNVFEVFGVIGLKAESFFNGLSEAGSALSSFAGKVEMVVDTAKKIDGVITGISDKAVSATTTFVTETFSIAKAIDENIMQVVDRAGETVIGAFRAMATEGVAFFKNVMQEGMSFDTAMGQVGATLLQTRDDMDATTVSVDGFNGTLREFAKKMGAETMFTATQSAEALNYMALAGYDAQTSAEMLPKVLNLAAAGAMDLGAASDMVTDSQTALGLSLEDTSIMIDQMAKTASSSNTSVSQLGDAILAIGATGRQVKGGFTELNTVLGVLADNGIKASESGNMLRRLLTNLTTAEGEAKEQLDKLGVSVFDAQGNMRDLPSIFLELDKAMSKLTDQERTKAISDIFGQYSLAGANALLKTSAKRWEELGEKIKDSEGAAEAMADIQLDTLPGQIAILQSAFSGLQTELYEKVAPATKEFVETLSSGLSDVTAEITEGNWGEAFSKLGETAVKLINKGVDTILNSDDTVTKFVDGFAAVFEKVGTALFEGGTQVLPKLLSHILNFATKIITSFSDFLSKEENIKTIEDTVSQLFSQLETFFDKNQDDLYTIFSTLFDLGVEFIDELFVLKRETIYSILYTKFTEILSDLTENLGTYLSDEKVTETVDNVLSFIGEVAQTLLDSSSVILPELLDFVLDIGDKIITGMVDFLSDEENLEKIRGTINLLLIKLQTFLDEHEDDLYTIFDTIYDVGIGFVKQIFTMKRKTTSDILWRKIEDIFQPVGDAIWNWIDKWIVHFGDTWESLFQPIGDALGRWLAKKRDEIKQSFKDIKTFFSRWWNTIIKFWSDKLLDIKDWLDESKELITLAFENIDLSEIGKDIIKGLWNGISNMKDWLIEKIGGFTDGIIDSFKDFFGIQSPSKVMRDEVGRFLAEGVGVGFTKEMGKVTKDMEKALPTNFDSKIYELQKNFPTAFDINADIVSKSVPTQSNFGGNTFELHIENFYNNTPDDIHKIGKLIYDDVFRQKVAMI